MPDDEPLRAILERLERKIDGLAQEHPRTGILRGAREIAGYLRCHERTVRRWGTRYRLPMAHQPDGKLITTSALIDAWILERREKQYSRPLGKGRKTYPER
ncbi:MAG: hypothetical protein KGL32_01235 [candidate division NC10 bacterium]|nr:hypothetical protein [candidate division NC10 bacterium]